MHPYLEALRADRVLLPTLGRLERAGIAGRARARLQSYTALLASASTDQLGRLDALLEVGVAGVTPLAWMREVATAPKAENVRALLDRLNFVRGIGIAADAAGRIHPDRFRQLVREGRVSSAQLLASYTTARRRDFGGSRDRPRSAVDRCRARYGRPHDRRQFHSR